MAEWSRSLSLSPGPLPHISGCHLGLRDEQMWPEGGHSVWRGPRPSGTDPRQPPQGISRPLCRFTGALRVFSSTPLTPSPSPQMVGRDLSLKGCQGALHWGLGSGAQLWALG